MWLTTKDGLFPFLSGCFRASTLGLNPLGMKLSQDILSTTATWRMLKVSIRLSEEDNREGSYWLEQQIENVTGRYGFVTYIQH